MPSVSPQRTAHSGKIDTIQSRHAQAKWPCSTLGGLTMCRRSSADRMTVVSEGHLLVFCCNAPFLCYNHQRCSRFCSQHRGSTVLLNCLSPLQLVLCRGGDRLLGNQRRPAAWSIAVGFTRKSLKRSGKFRHGIPARKRYNVAWKNRRLPRAS